MRKNRQTRSPAGIDPDLLELIKQDPALTRMTLQRTFDAENEINYRTGEGVITLPQLSARQAVDRPRSTMIEIVRLTRDLVYAFFERL